MKLSIIGMGRVGQAIAFASIIQNLADEMILVGRSADSAIGDALDLRQASCFSNPTLVRSGVIDDTAGSDMVVISASAARDVVVADRRGQVQANGALFRQLVPPLARLNPNAVFLVVTNPVEALTQLAQELSGLPHSQVLGTGTLIDTVRLRALLAQRCAVHPADLRIYVLGEHGDSQVAVLSSASAGGAPLGLPMAELEQLAAEARDGGYEVARAKGYTSHAVALATMMILDAVAKNTHTILPVSARLTDYCGVSDICLSVPAVIGRGGIIRTLPVKMDEAEMQAFRRSADAVRATVASIL